MIQFRKGEEVVYEDMRLNGGCDEDVLYFAHDDETHANTIAVGHEIYSQTVLTPDDRGYFDHNRPAFEGQLGVYEGMLYVGQMGGRGPLWHVYRSDQVIIPS